MNRVQRLMEIGLTEKEAQVYLATLELGDAPAQEISSKADVNRATTYVILENLLQKGIVSKYEKNKKTHFIAENPLTLKALIRQREEELKRKEHLLNDLTPHLNSIYNMHPHKPVVRFYEGKEGLKTMLDDFLTTETKEAYEVFPVEELRDVFTESEMIEHGKKRRSLGIKGHGIYSTRGKKVKTDELTEAFKVPDDAYKIFSDILIYGDKVFYASLKGQLSGVVIESNAIAETMKTVFKLAFERLQDLEENKKAADFVSGETKGDNVE